MRLTRICVCTTWVSRWRTRTRPARGHVFDYRIEQFAGDFRNISAPLVQYEPAWALGVSSCITSAIGAGPSTTGPLPCPPFTWQAAQDAALKSDPRPRRATPGVPAGTHTVLNTDSPRASCADSVFPIDRERAEGSSDAKGLPVAAQACSCAHNPASPTTPTPITLPSPLRTDSKPTSPPMQARWRTGRAGGRQYQDALRYQTPSMWRTAVWR